MNPLKINGQTVPVGSEPETPLLWLLRGELKLTGTKFGCGIAQCGSCTVHLDGEPVRSCSVPISAIGERAVTTIEGLAAAEPRLCNAVRAAWLEVDVVQCGYCQSGQIMTAVALLRTKSQPSDAEIDAAFAGNLCRCGTYPRIRAAVHAAVLAMQARLAGA